MTGRALSDIVAVIPTYNEAPNIVRLIGDLLDLPIALDVLVVDDNSPDGTGQRADEAAVRRPGRVFAMHRARKLGLGTAYIAGWRWALGRDYPRILTMDADYSHHPRHIPDIVAAAERYDLVIGSRYVPGGAVSGSTLFRRALSHGANWLARSMLSLRISDLTGSFRLFRRAVIESLPLDDIRSEGYSFPIEVAYLARQAGYSIGEVPILFENRTLGASKVSRSEIYRALFTLVRLGIAHRPAGAGRAPR